MKYKICGRKTAWCKLRYYPGIFWKQGEKTRTTSVSIAGPKDDDLNPESPE
jgi:hypothetical protein